MFTTQEKLNEVFTSGTVSQKDIQNRIASLSSDDSVIKAIKYMTEETRKLIYDGLISIVSLIDKSPLVAKFVITDAFSKTSLSPYISSITNLIDINPQFAKEFIMTEAVAFDLLAESLKARE